MSHDLLQTLIAAIGAATTMTVAAAVWYQTRRHFEITHAFRFIERWNQPDMIAVRAAADLFVEQINSDGKFTSQLSPQARKAGDMQAAVVMNLLTEFATAFIHGNVDRKYSRRVYGSLVLSYHKRYRNYITWSNLDGGPYFQVFLMLCYILTPDETYATSLRAEIVETGEVTWSRLDRLRRRHQQKAA